MFFCTTSSGTPPVALVCSYNGTPSPGSRTKIPTNFLQIFVSPTVHVAIWFIRSYISPSMLIFHHKDRESSCRRHDSRPRRAYIYPPGSCRSVHVAMVYAITLYLVHDMSPYMVHVCLENIFILLISSSIYLRSAVASSATHCTA